MSRTDDILREHRWFWNAESCSCADGVRYQFLPDWEAHVAALLDAAPVADREALATIIEPALVEASNKFVPMSYKTLAAAAARALVDSGNARAAEALAPTVKLADDLAAAAARVCAEYDGVHRLRAALSKWYDHRAGIHGSGALLADGSTAEPDAAPRDAPDPLAAHYFYINMRDMGCSGCNQRYHDIPRAEAERLHAEHLAALRAALAEGGSESLLEQGQRLASERDDLIAQGVDPADLEVPIAPEGGSE